MTYRFGGRPLLIAASVVMLLVAGCSKGSNESAAKERRAPQTIRFPVSTAQVEARRVEYQVTAVGSVEAFEQVQVTARVAGVVERVHFAEGEVVQQQKVLVEIEPERYRLAVESARAAVQKATAAKTDAEAGLARREGVDARNPGLIIGEEIETWRTRAQTASAELFQARAASDLAELNLRDAYVRAPVSGVIQTRTVQTGEYTQAGKALATLIQREPLLLRFQVPEQDAARLRPAMATRFSVREATKEFQAVITHVAGSADPASRMVLVTARVTDTDRKVLRPGTFAEVRVPVGTAVQSAVIPQTAIRPSERGFLAYVVENETAKERVLTLGMRTADGRVEVRSGVNPGDVLVVRGAESLRDGVQVIVTPAADAPKPLSEPGSGGPAAIK
jgi:RND family efflux transporter MFP subunit